MKLPISWLKELIDFNCPLDELADKLTMAGLEVEEVTQIGDETVFDVKVTPNRGDWLSVLGVAREAAPLVGASVKMPEPKVTGTAPAASELVSIEIKDPDLCGRYVGVVVRGAKIEPSPDWMQARLIAAGMRPINNIVDVTNYVMLELGQPLHAFDLDLLNSSRVVVRRAKKGEKITSLDGTPRDLCEDMLVIADADRPVAIAGVMGGLDTEISENTKDILIEAANFAGTSIRRTSKHLGMVTEASYRFERGVDPSVADVAALRAAELMCEIAGGKAAEGVVDVYPTPAEARQVTTRVERANAMLGINLSAESMVDYLNGLHIKTTLNGDILTSTVPTFRPDVTREIDVIEEIGRAYGYENLPMTLPKAQKQGSDSKEGLFRDRVRRILMSCGGQEVLTHSLVDSDLAEIYGRSDQIIRLRNILTEDTDSMRPMITPNLLGVIERNQSHGINDICIFEIGKVYLKTPGGELIEKLAISGAVAGNLWRSSWSLPTGALESDFFICKGIVESLFDALGVTQVQYIESDDPLLHPTRRGRILINGVEVGIIGEVAPSVAEELDLKCRVNVYELDFETLMSFVPDTLTYRHVAKYPALHRHMAVVVPDDVKYERLEAIIAESGKGYIEQIRLLDVYRGEQVGTGRASLTVSMVFRSPEKTLTDEEVNSVLGSVKEALTRDIGAGFR
ncbi:MAG: phenylalanine--tRNA ligase subunit beta [Armatimonadota bacterium]|jgi:phenylalanyl-tRNA synthetase beta chain